MRSVLLVAVLAVFLTGSAFAGAIVFNDQSTNPTGWHVDTTNGVATSIYSGEGWGAAYDPGTNTVYWNNDSSLYSSPFSLGGLSGTLIGEMGLSGITTLSPTGLAYDTANNKLLGWRNIATEGFYEINVGTGAAALVNATPTALDLGGIDYDWSTGRFYGVNDGSNPGLYEILDIYGAPSFELIVPYPDGEDDIDGLAVGDGRAYLITDQPGSIYVVDIATKSYLTPLASPITNSGIFSAGAYVGSEAAIPEPGSAVLLGAGLLALLGLRRWRQGRPAA